MDSGLDSDVNSDIVIQMAFWSGLGAVALTLLLIAYITLLRIASRRKERRKQDFMLRWRNVLNENTLAHIDASHLPPVADSEVVFFLSYWNQLQHSVQGAAKVRLSSLAQTLDMNEAVGRLLRNGNNAERLLAIVGLMSFGKRSDLPALHDLLQSNKPVEVLSAASAILCISPEAVTEIMPVLVRRSDLSNAALANILKDADLDKVSLILSDLLKETFSVEDPDKPVRRRDVIRLILLSSIAEPAIVHPLLRELMDTTEDEEILAACLKVMRDPLDLPKIRRFVGHPNWRLRVHAVTALGELGDEKDLPTFIRLLSDPQWWVRYRAAQAISALPFATVERLEALKASLHDSFAVDMINQTISERTS